MVHERNAKIDRYKDKLKSKSMADLKSLAQRRAGSGSGDMPRQHAASMGGLGLGLRESKSLTLEAIAAQRK